MNIKFISEHRGLIGDIELTIDEAYEVHKILYKEASKEHILEHYEAGCDWGIGKYTWPEVLETVKLVKINNSVEKLLS